MIKDIQNELEKDELINKTEIIESDEFVNIISDKIILTIMDNDMYININVNLYADVSSLLTLTLKSIANRYFLNFYVSDMFVFDKNKDEIVFGEDAKQYQIDNINEYIDDEIWKENFLHNSYGIEC